MELITPSLHYIDKKILNNVCDKRINNIENLSPMLKFLKIKINYVDFYYRLIQTYNRFPKSLIYDVFNIYNKKMNSFTFAKRNNNNVLKYKFIEKINNYNFKIITENSLLKSTIFTMNIIYYYMCKLTAIKLNNPEIYNEIEKQLNQIDNLENIIDENKNDENKKTILDELFDSKLSKKELTNILIKSSEQSKNLEFLPQDIQENIYNDLQYADNEDFQFIEKDFEKVLETFTKISMNKEILKKHIQKLLNNSVNYFSSKSIPVFTDFLNSQNVCDVENIHLLHPTLRKFFIDDVVVRESKNVGKINIYCDVSSSMKGKKELFVKSFIVSMKDINILNDVFLFNSKVLNFNATLLNIARIKSDGCTDINQVVDHIKKTKQNSIIITDAQNNCNIYSPFAYFIGVNGANFSCFAKKQLCEYSKNKQLVIFDGDNIYNVDGNGNI
jgi:hypothetical protein